MTHFIPTHFSTSSNFVTTSGNVVEQAARCWSHAMSALTAVVVSLQGMSDRARQRRQLLSMGDMALKDVGFSGADADCEGNKHFWQA